MREKKSKLARKETSKRCKWTKTIQKNNHKRCRNDHKVVQVNEKHLSDEPLETQNKHESYLGCCCLVFFSSCMNLLQAFGEVSLISFRYFLFHIASRFKSRCRFIQSMVQALTAMTATDLNEHKVYLFKDKLFNLFLCPFSEK